MDVPYLTGRVVDNAEILSPSARDRICGAAKAHEDKTSDQIAVLTLPTLDGESVEGYATRVFESWKLGQKGKDNGVLVVVVPKDRKMRIEVGYGLEGTLPDVAAARIIRNVMTPAFKASDYDKGVGDGVAAIVAQLEGRGDAAGVAANIADSGSAVPAARRRSFEFNGPDIPWYMRILLGCFIFGVIGLFTVVGVLTPGCRLVPVRIPDPVLGDVPDHRHRSEGDRRAACRVPDRLPDRQTDPVPQSRSTRRPRWK